MFVLLPLAASRAPRMRPPLAPVPADPSLPPGASGSQCWDGYELGHTVGGGLGLSTNREADASRGFTLAGTTGGAANGFLVAAVSSFCVAYGFLTAPREGWYSLAGAPALVGGRAHPLRRRHMMGRLDWEPRRLIALYFEQLQDDPCLLPLELAIGYLRAALDDSILYDVGEGRLLST